MVTVEVGAFTIGVAVTIEGVLVGGKKGVVGLNGPRSITQPLQEVVRRISTIQQKHFFISSPAVDCISLFA